MSQSGGKMYSLVQVAIIFIHCHLTERQFSYNDCSLTLRIFILVQEKGPNIMNIFFLLTVLSGASVNCQSFSVTFQNSSKISTDQWMEFKGQISHLKSFTQCHWGKTRIFNAASCNIWSYCAKMSLKSSLQCVQMWFDRDYTYSAGRDLSIGYKIFDNVGRITIRPFLHRTWNYFCFTYESASKQSKFYLNGI